MDEKSFVGFDRWADILGWLKANGSHGRRAQWTYYASRQVNDEGRPVKVSCRVVMRNVNGKADEQIHVSPSPLSNTRFEPFQANATDHLGYFRREAHTSLPYRAPETGPKPFDPSSLPGPADGHFCKCGRCKAGYRALPFQSHALCTSCKPPTQRCRHGVTTFERCAECKKHTGSEVPSLGLTPIVVASR